MDNILKLIGRKKTVFDDDLIDYAPELEKMINKSKFLVLGAAGSIGKAVTIELFKRNPQLLHAVDINENNLVELVRDIRSSIGYSSGEFQTFALDCGSWEFNALCDTGTKYDFILNLSALKHVRSEKDPFTLMRLINVNILNTISVAKISLKHKARNYFCVSTDKAANPVNMMGASKRIMEKFLLKESLDQNISLARFANVAFSDGSLLHGFNQRFIHRQPISAPKDVLRYFITPKESGELCMLSALLGQNRDIFFPKLSSEIHLESFSNIAVRYLEDKGFEPIECESENEARLKAPKLISQKKWPVYFFDSDTTGEKEYEEFYTSNETLDLDRFRNIGVIRNAPDFDIDKLNSFLSEVKNLRSNSFWNKKDIVTLFKDLIPEFDHKETGKYLDSRM